jgi:hypothetical protein
VAELLLSGKELLDLVEKSVPLPSQIKKIQARGMDIVITISMSNFVPSFTIVMSFQEFKAGAVFFSVSSNTLVEWMMKIFKIPQPDFMSITHPILRIDIHKAFASNVPDLKIDDIRYENDQYRITLNSLPTFA